MKHLLILIFLLTSLHYSYAQAPEKFSYQAIVRDSEGMLIKNQPVKLRISILKGSTTSPAVYTESHNIQTNENGLVSLEIGTGIIDTDTENTSFNTFSAIEWGKDSYFLKVEADVKNDNTYSLSGISQLLSVPYALHAKTAANITDEEGNIVPIRSERYIGELYGGGIIFWLDSTGEHGLIVSLKDLSKEQIWSNVLTQEIGSEAAGSRVGGNKNPSSITNQGGHSESAAKLCLDYTNQDTGTGTFSDWYLPGIEEMKKLWGNLYEVEKSISSQTGMTSMESISANMYWTSTEYNGYCAWGFNFYNGNPYNNNKFTTGHVRAVRAF